MQQIEIKKLDDDLINQIKAGEVIERPFNVIKELLENAIDAEAQFIQIELLDGGKQLIRITDNGFGIPNKKLSLALERHATSKIFKFKDLEYLKSYGFRGEALPSIAAVSHFTIKSKQKNSDIGQEITIQFGKKIHEKEVPMQTGTVVQIKDLFADIPVRLKFLKSTPTEFSHIHDFLTAMAMAFYNKSFKLHHNGREIFYYQAKESLKNRFLEIIGSKGNEFIEIYFERGSFKIYGFLGNPSEAKTIPSFFVTFINNRFVKDKIIKAGVLQGLQGVLSKGLLVPAVLFIEVDSTWVDVNAHPSKIEVRFYDNAAIQDLVAIGISHSIKNGIQKNNESSVKKEIYIKNESKIDHSIQNKIQQYTKPTLNFNLKNKSSLFTPSQNIPVFINKEKGQQVSKLKITVDNINEQVLFTERKQSIFDSAKYLGQFLNCYLLLEIKQELWIVDQHAFHERILFEELMLNHKNSKMIKQQLITPIVIPSTAILTDLIFEHETSLNELGFEIERLSNSNLALHTYPSLLSLDKISTLFDEIIVRILSISGLPQSEVHPLIDRAKKVKAESLDSNPHYANLQKESVFHLLFATIACHSAVRAGDPLNEELIKRLMGRAKDVDFYSHCPHGRPVVRKFTEKDVSSWFLRT